jgi:quinol monooxygenase YgiN
MPSAAPGSVELPLVYVDHSDIVPGKLDELHAAIADLSGFVRKAEPRLVAYAAYVDADGRAMTVVHAHRDAASLETHLDVAGPRFAAFRPLVRLRSIDVYGDPGPRARELLEAKARLLGGKVTVHQGLAGFLR